MRIKGWLIGLTLALFALPAVAGSDWPHASPAEPLAQADRVCMPGVVELRRRCHVTDFARLGETADGHVWYYAFFSTRWADRHGRMTRGFPVISYLQHPATLRLSLWVNDEPGLSGRWAVTPPATRPVLIKRPEANYIGFSHLKAIDGPDDQRLFRQNKLHWKAVDILKRTDADQQKLDKATPSGCEAADDGVYDWAQFWFVLALRQRLSHEPCGYLTAPLAVHDMKVSFISAAYHKREGRPRVSSPPQSSGAPLTSASPATN